MEVASIGVSLVRHLRVLEKDEVILNHLPSDDLIDVICLLHDIGHPPFGHGGEAALNALMSPHGGFESNAQTLHLVSNLEMAYEPFGLDLTRRVLLGILKYPVCYQNLQPSKSKDDVENLLVQTNREKWASLKAYYHFNQELVDWILSPFVEEDRASFQQFKNQSALHHGLDCSLMDIADDIAYGVHDLEDAIHLGLILRHHLEASILEEICAQIPELDYFSVVDGLFSCHQAIRKQTIGGLVHFCYIHSN